MELLSREEILRRTRIRENQMKAFRRLNLIDGHVKKKSIVKVDDKKTKNMDRQFFKPAGFEYFYPSKVIQQIFWIVNQQKEGKTLREIHDAYIRIRIQKEEECTSYTTKFEG